MVAPPESVAIKQIAEVLEQLIGETAWPFIPVDENAGHQPDAVINVGPNTFMIEYRRSSSPSSIASAIGGVLHAVQFAVRPNVENPIIPLIVLPFMPSRGKSLASERGVAWIDLSGNAEIKASNILIHIEGRPNRFTQRGRPASPFAPKSSRIARWFLMNPGQQLRQSDLARATEVDVGLVSRVSRTMLGDGLLERTSEGMMFAPDLDLLLDAWRSTYDFSKHLVVRGHLPGRSGPDVLDQLSRLAETYGIKYAATGLSGAWLLNRFAGYRLSTVLVDQLIPDPELRRAGFRQDSGGSNVWIVVPNDHSVFWGAESVEGVQCAHPLQVYLDLSAHPERSSEAGLDLRRSRLDWSTDAA